jgi:phosphopantothenoylcysteine decarboxylase/phosphopantothenate--cysteine ligase
MIDPVRFITNLSSGEMGYAIARRAREKGFKVTLISGPTHLKVPKGVSYVPIVTVRDLERALRKHFRRNDILIMSAAVGDFIPEKRTTGKIPRSPHWKINFRQSPDLVRRAAQKKGRRLVIGFSLETGRWIKRSRQKMVRKNLDGIVANYFSPRHNPFGSSKVRAALINGKESRVVRSRSKLEFAGKLMNWVGQMAEGKALKN